MHHIVLASNNTKKIAELEALLAPLRLSVVSQGSLNIPETEEPFPTFVENALTKARHAARLSGLPALADDSGLCVDALGGAPGTRSARYAGDPRSDARNNAALLKAMAHLTQAEQRRARFVCVLAFLRHADDPQPLLFQGEWAGEIVQVAAGDGGFGYDPLFWDPALESTAANLPPHLKNARSHRGQAMAQLCVALSTLHLPTG